MCQTNQSIPGKGTQSNIDCHLHLDQSNNNSVIIIVLCVNVVYISASGVASPSLMPGLTMGSLIYLQWVV